MKVALSFDEINVAICDYATKKATGLTRGRPYAASCLMTIPDVPLHVHDAVSVALKNMTAEVIIIPKEDQ